eukprot:TRINITY_DN2567_c0_g1_i1.p1 TRINITY_DN2567_c0_g1~~TRINITY_DN2567_c0_g1_i1.p1  ORF type:complete len:1282 (-),score=375.63 TRINITY_DN2567_c0_g1_i1:194-4039(-)
MFVYLAKKIAIPNQVKLHCVAWNADAGYIACGGDNGLLKVLKLETPTGDRSKTSNNLSMNHTCDGHDAAVMCVAWNEACRKLTSSDARGIIMVWILYKGVWFDEMTNDRQRSVVRDLKWTPDGHKIVIVYEDGYVIVGSIDGHRLWARDLKTNLTRVEWSPDSRYLLMGLTTPEVHLYDAHSGNFLTPVPIKCLEGSENATSAKLVAVHWYDGTDGYADPLAPTLAISFDDGSVQLMRSESDEKPICFRCGLAVTTMRWSWQGTVLAIGGSPLSPSQRQQVQVRFYDPLGKLLRTLRLPPSGSVTALSWEGSGLRIALAVDWFIFFANVRPAYLWAYFGRTMVYGFTRPERPDHTVVFWNTKTGERSVKYVKRLLMTRAYGQTCMLVTRTDDFTPPAQIGGQVSAPADETRDEKGEKGTSPHVVVLCNEIGGPVDSKYVEMTPVASSMNSNFVCVCSADMVYVWQYASIVSKHDVLDAHAGTAVVMRHKDQRERLFHIEETVQPWPVDMSTDVPVSSATYAAKIALQAQSRSDDPIVATCMSDTAILIARDSGLVHQYSLPLVGLVNKFTLMCRPSQIALNKSSKRMSVIDSHGVLSFYDLQPIVHTMSGFSGQPQPGVRVPLERKEVWAMQWADDDERLIAVMEKTRLYVFRDLEPSEPILSSSYLCGFSDLKVRTAMLDDLMADPDHPVRDHVVTYPTKILRDTRELLKSVVVSDAVTFVEENPHPRLWRLLAEAALQKLNFGVSERAFVRCEDYQGIQFIKRLRQLTDVRKQEAEVAAYFKRFDEAERIYRDMDRKDLAVDLRVRLGDWFKVVQLVQEGGGDDAIIHDAWNHIADYYADRQKWAKAVQYYSQARNYERLIDFYYLLEDYRSLTRLTEHLPQGASLLITLGDKFTSVGFCENAVAAYLKGGDVQKAVDTCIELNQWDQAMELAEQHKIPNVEDRLTQYAAQLVAREDVTHAIELYRKARQHAAAATLLAGLGRAAGAQSLPLRAKQFFVLSAIELERNKARLVDLRKGQDVVDGLLAHDRATGTDRTLDAAWRGAEAYHFLLLCQRQLYSNEVRAALTTAMRLAQYDDLLNEQQVYGLIALCSWCAGDWACGSMAFTKLEALEEKIEEASTKVTQSEGKGILPSMDVMLDNLTSAVSRIAAGGDVDDDDDQPTVRRQERDAMETLREQYGALAVELFTRYPPGPIRPPGTYRCNGRDNKCGAELLEWAMVCRDCGQQLYACVASGRVLLPQQAKGTVVVCQQCQHRMYSMVLEKQHLRNCPLCHHPLPA